MAHNIKSIRSDIRETRKEMRAKGIKRTSCFNGGLHGEVYSLNARMFALETELQTALKAASSFVDVSNVQEYGLTQKLSQSIRCF